MQENEKGKKYFMTKREEQLRHKESLLQKKEHVLMQLDSITKVKEFIQFPDLSGRKVKNKKLGEGVIGESGGQYFTVIFPAGVKKYVFPDSFSKGFLEIDDVPLLQSCKKYQEILSKEEELLSEVKKLETELTML